MYLSVLDRKGRYDFQRERERYTTVGENSSVYLEIEQAKIMAALRPVTAISTILTIPTSCLYSSSCSRTLNFSRDSINRFSSSKISKERFPCFQEITWGGVKGKKWIEEKIHAGILLPVKCKYDDWLSNRPSWIIFLIHWLRERISSGRERFWQRKVVGLRSFTFWSFGMLHGTQGRTLLGDREKTNHNKWMELLAVGILCFGIGKNLGVTVWGYKS